MVEVIGISGPPCSGKDTGANYLGDNYGFRVISTGDLLRARACVLGVGTDRSSLQQLGSKLRASNGSRDPLLAEALAETDQDTIFTGIRTFDAARTLINVGAAILYITSPLEQRYARSIIRARDDVVSYDEFVAQDEIEHAGAGDWDMALLSIKALASYTILNDGSLAEFRGKLDTFMESLDRNRNKEEHDRN